jgi:hypothetical protein
LSALLPRVNWGLEIGVGTGRFAVPLGVRWGVDPSIRMGKMAKARGIQVVSGRAESLPFKACRICLTLMIGTKKWLAPWRRGRG